MMKDNTSILIGMLLLAVSAVHAETYTFVGGSSSGNIWNDADNWEDSSQMHTGYPNGDDDDAIIPAGKIVEVRTTATTGSINVGRDGSSIGAIMIQAGDLKLGNDRDVDSIVNGYVLFQDCAVSGDCLGELVLAGGEQQTIKSTGGYAGEIRGANNWDPIPGYGVLHRGAIAALTPADDTL